MSDINREMPEDLPPKRKHPFDNLKIDDRKILKEVGDREKCVKCNKSRKFYCYSCFIPLPALKGRLPRVKLPIKIDIIKHRQEIDGKSSAGHAAILAPDDVRIYIYPNIPDYSLEDDVVLIFPSSKAVSVNSLFNGHTKYEIIENFGNPTGIHMGTMMKKQLEDIVVDKSQLVLGEEKLRSDYTLDNLPIKRAVFIDSTWSQCRSIYQDPKVNSIRPVVLQNRITQFWRPQKGSPRWYLSTIEAIHQFLLEVHTSAWGMNTNYRGLDNLEVDLPFLSPSKLINLPSDVSSVDLCVPYDGQYDNLLYFFIHMYEIIHDRYDHDQKLAYKRPLV